MKKILCIASLLPVFALAQTTTENYVRIYTYKDYTTTSDPAKATAEVTYYDGLGRPSQQIRGKMGGTGNDLIIPIEYDVFGRQAREYMPYEASTSNLSFSATAATDVVTFYNKPAFENTSNPYSEKIYDNSPLNRVMEQGAPGTIWKANDQDNNDRTVKYGYLCNSGGEVKNLNAATIWNSTIKMYTTTILDYGTYNQGELFTTITRDENTLGNISTLGWTPGQLIEYRDKAGRLILKQSFYSTTDNFGMSQQAFSCTYYVYDQYGNLTYVIPTAFPSIIDTSTNFLNQYGYQYKYDLRNRLVEKKLPGKDWEYIVYDNFDRPVASGPVYSPFGSTSNAQKGWLITKYDVFGRVSYTGWYASASFSSSARATVQANTFGTETKTTSAVMIDNVAVYYTNASFPTTGLKLLTVHYYDTYTFPSAAAFPSSGVEGTTAITNAKGLPTGTWTRIITNSSETFAEVSTTFYDSKGRPIRLRTTNTQLGGYSQIDSKLDFRGTPQYIKTRHKRTNSGSEQELVVQNNFSYTDQDRLLSETHTIGSLTPELMSYNTYNNIGQLTQKRVGRSQTSPLQYVNFSYNIRGWLKGINDTNNLGGLKGIPTDLFAFSINYTEPSQHANVSQNYNGNITETSWRTSSDNILRRYSYDYDEVNRLRESYYQLPAAVEPMRNSYDEKIKYDYLGNIIKLNRNGGLDSDTTVVPIDNLTYTYTGNRLDKIVDSTNSPQGFNDKTATTVTDFAYDTFGNLTSDLNKGITSNGITYNHLNLPVKIVINSDTASGIISYIYNAAGGKITKIVTNTVTGSVTTTDYLSGFQYTNTILDFFPTSAGYVKNTVVNNANSYNYVYQYKDHLGNIRLSYTLDPTDNKVKIMEENHYYPFGLKHLGYSSDQLILHPGGGFEPFPIVLTPVINPGDVTYKYKYNGKELQNELELNVYDYGWRNYDPAIGRFLRVDRFAEKYYNATPYGYSGNNPILFNDIQGDSIGVGKDLFERFRNDVQSRKDKILADRQDRIDKALSNGDSDKAQKLQNRFARQDASNKSDMSILNETLSELSSLENSSQLYNLFENSDEVPKTADGITTYDTSTNAVNVSSKELFSMGVFAHELKHAFQFEKGMLSFGGNGSQGGALYDLNDEYEAFARGAFFGGLNLTTLEINSYYPNRPLGPISLTTMSGLSTYGHQLKLRTVTAASRGTAQQEFYINWKDDTKK